MKVLFILALAAITPIAASASVRTYTPDANTLHLWHLDESAAPAVDAGTDRLDLPVLSGGATLGNTSFPGFGSALSTFDSGLTGSPASTDAYLSALTLVNGAGDETTLNYRNAATGAFTFEAMIRLDVDLTQTFAGSARGVAPMHVFSGEGEANANRIWQFRLDPIGFNPNADGFTSPLTAPALEFINVNEAVAPVQNRVMLLPLTGPDALAVGAWFHVAVVYDGNEGIPNNLTIYWTKIDATRTQPDVLIQRQLDTDLPISQVDFAIGNIGRNPSASNFLGLIDEIRISDIARGPGELIFVPEPGTALLVLNGFGAILLRPRRR
jgi:hypothetical protein